VDDLSSAADTVVESGFRGQQQQRWQELDLIRNFPEKMLAKKLLTSYHNTPEQPYNEKSVRTVPAREDLSY